MKRDFTKKFKLDNTCAICGEYIPRGNKTWVTSDTNEEIAGIAFVTHDGTPVEGFDICDDCIGRIYSRIVY